MSMSLLSLSEKIRLLNINSGLKGKETIKWESLLRVDLKYQACEATSVFLVAEEQPTTPLLLHQPVAVASIHSENDESVRNIYRIPATEAIDVPLITPIIYPFPNQRGKIRRKKKRSITYTRIEELLSRGKNTLILPEPSEESIPVEDFEDIQEDHVKDISDLSEDILQRVFWYFTLKERCTILSRVCRQWYYILKDPIFWTHLEFTGNKVQTEVIVHLVRSSPMLSSLRLTTVPEVKVILETCSDKTGLKELGLRYCALQETDINALLQLFSLPNLETLDLKGSEFRSKRFFMELGLLKNFKSLNLGANRYLNPQDLMTLSINCHSLQTLKILNIPSYADDERKITDDNFSFIISNLQDSLTNLQFDMQRLGNSAYTAILQCKKLHSLCLTNCLFLTGEMFRKFGQFKRLKNLTITRGINLSSEDFAIAFYNGNLSNIEYLNINGCWRIDGTGLKAITQGLPLLKVLSLEKCTSIRGNDLTLIYFCKNISSLNVAFTSITPEDLMMLERPIWHGNLRSLTIAEDYRNDRSVLDLQSLFPKLKINFRDATM